jgi:hypothetical protein
MTFQELFWGTCGLGISVLVRTQPLTEIGSGSTVMPTSGMNSLRKQLGSKPTKDGCITYRTVLASRNRIV